MSDIATGYNAEPYEHDSPLAAFGHSHDRILSQMKRLQGLSAQLQRSGLDPNLRLAAGELYEFFHAAVLPHHDDEEKDLFPAMRRCAAKGDERGLVESIIARLEREHHELEALWDRIEPAMRRLARGKAATLDGAVVDELVSRYTAHAQFEEKAVLPLAQAMLKEGDQAALSLSLALKRKPTWVRGYI